MEQCIAKIEVNKASLGDAAKMAKRRLSSRRMKNGCKACKKRHRRCDVKQYSCVYCMRKGIVCEREYNENLTSVLYSARSEQDLNSIVVRKNDGGSLPISLISCGKSMNDNEFFLFNYFLTNTAFAVVAIPAYERNVYLDTIVPLSFENEALWYSLLSLSAQHCKGTSNSFEEILERMYMRALHTFYRDLNKDSKDPIIMVSLCLMLINNEISINKIERRDIFLRLAATAISDNGGARAFVQKSSYANQLMKLFVYHDYMSSLISGKECFTKSLGFNDSYNEEGMQHWDYEPDLFFGIAKSLFGHIIRIPNILSNNGSCSCSFNSMAEYEAIEMALQSWQLPKELNMLVEKKNIRNLMSQNHEGIDLLSLAESAIAIQWAGILIHHQARYGYSLDDPKVRAASENIVEAISYVKEGSPLESLILFPLIMAAVGGGNRDFLLARFNNISSNIGFDHINTAIKFIEEVWCNCDNGKLYDINDNGFNWQRLLREKYGHLSMV